MWSKFPSHVEDGRRLTGHMASEEGDTFGCFYLTRVRVQFVVIASSGDEMVRWEHVSVRGQADGGLAGGGGKRRIFDTVCEAFPHALSQQDVAAACGMEASGGTWRNYLGELRGLDLIVGKGELGASPELFQE
jgi:hypothetical protein